MPLHAKAAFGAARAPVRCTLNGVDYRSRLVVYGEKTYEGLAFSNRTEYAQWIAEAKREETRERRVGKAVTMLREGVKHP